MLLEQRLLISLGPADWIWHLPLQISNTETEPVALDKNQP